MKRLLTILILFIILLGIGFGFQAAHASQHYNMWLFEVNLFGLSIRMIDFLIGSIVLSISLMLMLSIFIFGNRKKMERRGKIKDKYFALYQKMLMDYLFESNGIDANLDDVRKKYVKELRKISSGSYKRQLLIEQFCDLNLNLTGLNNERLQKLYFDMKLHKSTYKKVHSVYWHRKIKGFKELYAMNITKKNKVLYKYINSKNDLVRIEAQIALVDLSKEDKTVDAFDFLHKLKTPFSLWEQITLHQVLVQRDIRIPDFGEWMMSENKTVSMFCLRMIREFRQSQNAQNLQLLAQHKDEDIRKLAIQVMGDLKLTENIRSLKSRYKYEPQDIGLEIIKSIGKTQDPSFIRFLQNIIDKEDSADLQIEALKAIHNMGEEGQVALDKMLKSEYKNYNIIIKHVLDHRI